MMRVGAYAETDREQVRRITTAAFGRSDEADLVEALRDEGVVIAECVAKDDDTVIGHILFSALTAGDGAQLAALAPMAVVPGRQRGGIGSALIGAGLVACRDSGVGGVVVLGHPEYYPRFGFSSHRAAVLNAPFRGPAFMALPLSEHDPFSGRTIRYARAFGIED